MIAEVVTWPLDSRMYSKIWGAGLEVRSMVCGEGPETQNHKPAKTPKPQP